MSKHMEVEGDRLVLNPRKPGMLFVAVCTALYLAALYGAGQNLVNRIGAGAPYGGPLTGLVAFTIVWALLVRHANCRVVLDGGAQKVYRKSYFGRKELMDFSAIGGVTPIEENYQGARAGTYYVLAPRGDRFGKGVRITGRILKDSELAEFEENELAAIRAFLARHAVAIGPAAATEKRMRDVSGLPVDTRHFRRDGDVFTMSYGIRWLIFLAAAIAFAYIGMTTKASDDRTVYFIIAGVAAFLAVIAPIKLVLDAGERKVRHYIAFGMKKTECDFDDFSHFASVRQSYNLIPVGTYVSMIMGNRANPDKPISILLGRGFSTRRLDAIAEEAKLVLGGAAEDKETIREGEGDEKG